MRLRTWLCWPPSLCSSQQTPCCPFGGLMQPMNTLLAVAGPFTNPPPQLSVVFILASLFLYWFHVYSLLVRQAYTLHSVPLDYHIHTQNSPHSHRFLKRQYTGEGEREQKRPNGSEPRHFSPELIVQLGCSIWRTK